MDPILSIARAMISPWSKTRSRAVWKVSRAAPGNFRCLATQSFHETKNITAVKGAPWLLMMPGSSNRPRFYAKKARTAAAFSAQVDKYTWVDLDQAICLRYPGCFLCAQLEQREAIQVRRQRVWEFYLQALDGWAESITCACLLFHYAKTLPHVLHAPTRSEQRQALINHLRSRAFTVCFIICPCTFRIWA